MKTTETGMRVPRITGLPWQIGGVVCDRVASLPVLAQATFDVLVENACDQGLVGNPFRHGFLLKTPPVLGGEPDVDPRILPEHRFRVFPVPLLHIRCIGRLLELPGLKGLQEFTLVLIQPAQLGSPR
jgi:hypothetical protein